MANRYWVTGGTGDWGSTTNWSATFGGARGASVPTTADNVFFGQVATYTVTLSGIYGTPNCLDITVSAGTVTFSGGAIATIYGSLSFISTTTWNVYTVFKGTSAKTITTNGVSFGSYVELNGVGGSWQLLDAMTLSSGNIFTLTNGTLNLNNKTLTTPTFDGSNANTRTIAFGTGNITCTNAGMVAGTVIFSTNVSTGLTVTGNPIVNISYAGSLSALIATGSLTETNTISFNIASGSYALALNASSIKSIDFTGFSGSLTVSSVIFFYGSLTLSTGMTVVGAAISFLFRATSGIQKITSNGKTLDYPIIINGVGGTVQLADALTMGSTRLFTHTNGTIDLNGKTLTVGTAYTTAAGTKNLTFNGGTLVCPTAATTAFNNAAPTNYTTTAGTGTGKISMTAATAKTFVGGGSTFNCTLSNDGAGALTITGANTFTTIANGVQPTSFLFTAATTTTVTNWSVSGTVGNLVTISSATAATHTLSKPSGIVNANYLSVSYSIATGGATWYAGNNSTNGGNNTGWLFSAAPAAYSITATNGTYALNGQSVGIARGIVLSGSYGSYAVTGRNITIAKGNLLLPQNGLYSLAGQTIDISYSGAPPVTGPTQYFIEIRSFTESRRI